VSLIGAGARLDRQSLIRVVDAPDMLALGEVSPTSGALPSRAAVIVRLGMVQQFVRLTVFVRFSRSKRHRRSWQCRSRCRACPPPGYGHALLVVMARGSRSLSPSKSTGVSGESSKLEWKVTVDFGASSSPGDRRKTCSSRLRLRCSTTRDARPDVNRDRLAHSGNLSDSANIPLIASSDALSRDDFSSRSAC